MAIAERQLDSTPSTNGSRWHEIPADQVSEALVASLKLNGIDRLWFVSGSELSFFQEGSIKNKALGRPAPEIMTMTHENAALAAGRPTGPQTAVGAGFGLGNRPGGPSEEDLAAMQKLLGR